MSTTGQEVFYFSSYCQDIQEFSQTQHPISLVIQKNQDPQKAASFQISALPHTWNSPLGHSQTPQLGVSRFWPRMSGAPQAEMKPGSLGCQ